MKRQSFINNFLLAKANVVFLIGFLILMIIGILESCFAGLNYHFPHIQISSVALLLLLVSDCIYTAIESINRHMRNQNTLIRSLQLVYSQKYAIPCIYQ